MKHLPNALTLLRLALSLLVFVALAGAGGAMPWTATIAAPMLERWAFGAFVVAAVTDFFDGWLARRYQVVSVAGRILDPIADKVLVAAAVLGLMALGPSRWTTPAFGLILFREFAVSALREVAAGAAVTLHVTLLAKWKTTLQLIALGALMAAAGWAVPGWAGGVAIALLWIAAAVTLITGAQYGVVAWRGLAAGRSAEPPPRPPSALPLPPTGARAAGDVSSTPSGRRAGGRGPPGR